MATRLTPVDGDPFAAQPATTKPKPKLTPVSGDPFAPPPSLVDRAGSALSHAFHSVADFVTNSPADQRVRANIAAGRPMPDAFGSVAATVPRAEGVAGLVSDDPLTLSDIVSGNRTKTSAAGSFRRNAGRSAIPALGGAAAFGPGFAAGGVITSPAEAIPVAGPIINLVGALAGGTAAAMGGGWIVNKAQDKVLSMLPDSMVHALGQDEAQRQADQTQHPISSFSGGLAPALLTMRPGFSGSQVAADAPLLTRALASPVAGSAIGASLSGGGELAHEVSSGEDLSPEKLAIATAVGAALNRPTKLGSALFEGGGNATIRAAQLGARAAGRAAGFGNDNGARQPFDVETTATAVPREALPPPEAIPSEAQPVAEPTRAPVARTASPPRLVPVSGDPFAPTPAAGAPSPPGAVDPQPVANPNPAAAGGDGLGQDAAPLRPEPGDVADGERLVRTPAGASIRTRMGVVDASQLTQAEGDNQNRDRSRGSTDLQVQDIISKFDPELLHEDSSSDRGAPIVGPDNAIDSGNGRVLTLNKIYDEHPELAAKYKAMIESRGFSTEGMDRPILVQHRVTDFTPEQRRQFVIDSNKDSKLALTNIERAKSDADALDSNTLGLYRGGDVHSAANSDFVKAFHSRLTGSELAAQVDANGNLSQGGIDRIEHALMARAYENPTILSKLMESRDNNIRSIGSGMLDNAGGWAQLRAGVKDGTIKPEFDVTDKLVEAARRVSDLRARGGKIGDELAQTSLVDTIDPVTEAFMRLFYSNQKGHSDPLQRAASREAVTDALRSYVAQASAQTTGEQLFGASETTPAAILQNILDKRGKPGGDMFAQEDRAPTKESDRDRHSDVYEGTVRGDARTEPAGSTGSSASSSRGGLPIKASTGSAAGDRGDAPANTGADDAPTAPDADAAPRGATRGVGERAGPHEDAGTGNRAGDAASGTHHDDSLKAIKAAADVGDEPETPDYSDGLPAEDKRAYDPTFEEASFTDRTSIFNSAAEAVGLDPDKFTLLPAPRQVALLKQAIAAKFGIGVDVDRGMQERFAIDQMLDAFQNVQSMAHVLDLPNAAMSLNGKLSLRLQKSGNFLGMFQSGLNIITLPKRSNSFAHEWGHALDYFLLENIAEGGGRGLSGAVRKGGDKVGDLSPPPGTIRDAFVELMNAMFFDKAGVAAKIMEHEAVIAKTKGAKTRAAAQLAIDKLKQGNSQVRDIRSAFYKGAQTFDGPGGEYWTSPTEMLARAFEAYTSYKVEAAGLTTEFIGKGDAQYLDGAGSRFELTFPKGEERAFIFSAFETVFEQIASAHLLGAGAGADKPGGTVRRMTDYDKTPRVAKERNVIKRELAAIKRGVTQSKREKLDRANDPKGKLEKLADINAPVFMSMTGNLRMIQGRSGSAALQKLIDLLTKQDGRGDRTVARTFSEDVHLQSKAAINRLANILKANGAEHLDHDDSVLLRDLLIGAREDAPPGMGHIVKAAAAIRHLLDNEFYVNQAAGIDLGYTRNGYLSRVLDMPKVWADKDGFVAAASNVYEVVFNNEFGTPGSLLSNEAQLPVFMRLAAFLAKKGYDLPSLDGVRAMLKEASKLAAAIDASKDPAPLEAKLEALMKKLEPEFSALHGEVRPAYANERAQAWLAKVNLVAGEEHNASNPDSKYTKHRELPPEADKLMEQFYLSDPVESVINYLNASARRTAYARRFGADGKKRVKLFERMAAEGVSPADQRTVEGILDIATGRRRSELNAGFLKGLAWVNAMGTMALLPRAMISSLAEPFNAALVTGDPRTGFKMLGMQLGSALGSPSGKVRFELARAMGIISDLAAEGIMEARYGQTYADETRADRAVAAMFRRTGLTPLTRAQKTAGVGIAHAFLDNLAHHIGGRKTSIEYRNAIALMRELGISDPEAFSAELLKLGRLPTVEELDTPFGEDYRTAQLRFSDMIVQNPNAMDRPELSQNPVGRILFSITGFSYGYWRNIVKRNGILIKQISQRGGNRAEGAAHAGYYAGKLIAAAALAYLIGTTVSTIREYYLNRKRWHDLEQKGELESTMAQLGFTRVFAFGAGDPAIQAYTGLKYQRDLGTAILGAKLGYFADSAERIVKPTVKNSRKTNTAEFHAAQGAYQIASPFMAFGLSRIPGGPLTDVATGIGMAYVTSPAARDEAATLLVGPKNLSLGPDGKKVRSGPSGYDKMLDGAFGPVKPKERAD